jgi:SNF2 family DNA or RNA helicase
MCEVNSQALSSLATQVDVTDVITLYHDFFTSNQDGEASNVNEDQLSVRFGSAEKGADPGVEVESSMTRENITSNLGFRNELPLLFNPIRHKNGLSPWSHPATFKNISGNDPDLEPLTLFWHQLAGVHAIIRMNFHPTKDSSRCNGTLIADEVGLGKTFQAATVIVTLADLVIRQQQKISLPPIISSSTLQFICRLPS